MFSCGLYVGGPMLDPFEAIAGSQSLETKRPGPAVGLTAVRRAGCQVIAFSPLSLRKGESCCE